MSITSQGCTDGEEGSDDGISLAPVDVASEIDDFEVVPIEPPPFPPSRPRRRIERPSRAAETTSTPEETDESPPVKRKPDTEFPERVRQRDKDAAPRAVFKPDSRQVSTPTTVFPNRAVCRLLVRFPITASNLVYAGTGNMIGSRHVLTAAHVIYNPLEGGWASTIIVEAGRDGSGKLVASESLVWPNFKQRSVTGYTEGLDIDYDYALITLNKGFSVGSFGLLYASDSTLDNTTAYLLGYAGERGSPPGSQQFGVPTGGKITDYDSRLVYYSIDSSGGQSGSGVYRFWNGKHAIIAVHGGQYDSDENRGARITKARHDQIRGWQEADK